MYRPTDWSPLWDGDPIPGDPGVVRRGAATFRATARSIHDAADALGTAVDGVSMCSEAVNEFTDKAVKVRQSILKTRSRYSDAAAVLTTYAGALETAQADSYRLWQQACEQDQDRQRNQTWADDARDRAAAATDPVAERTARAEANRYQANANQHSDSISTYRDQLDAVIARRDSAAKTAVDGIDDAEERSAIDGDSIWDKIKDVLDKVTAWIAEYGDLIAGILSKVSMALMVVGFVAMLIPGAQPLGAALLAASRVVGLASSAVTAVTMAAKLYQATQGNGSYADVGKEALVFGLTMVGGRVASKLIKTGGNAITSRMVGSQVKKSMSAQKWGQIKGGVVTQGKSLKDRVRFLTTGSYKSDAIAKTDTVISHISKPLGGVKIHVRPALSPDKFESINSYVLSSGKFDTASRLTALVGMTGSDIAAQQGSSFVKGHVNQFLSDHIMHTESGSISPSPQPAPSPQPSPSPQPAPAGGGR